MAVGLRIRSGGQTTFDSNNGHMLIDINNVPKHIGLVTFTPAAQTSGGQMHTAIAYDYKHGLDYTPFVETYFFPAQSESLSVYSPLGVSYYKNFYSFIDLGSTSTDDLIVRVGPTKLTVVYRYQNTSATPSAPTTSSPHAVTMKFLIFSNEGYWQSGAS